jgi:hypothetical protein
MIGKPVGWAEHDAVAYARATFKGGKTGLQKKWVYPEAGPFLGLVAMPFS